MIKITILGIAALVLMAEGVVEASSFLDRSETSQPIRVSGAGETFSIAAVADPQYADVPAGWRGGGREPEEGVNRLSYAVSQYNQRSLDWGVIVGDMIDFDDIDYGNPPPGTVSATGTQDWSNADAILAAWNQINVPSYLVIGNHEFYVPNVDVDGMKKPYSVYRKFGFTDRAYYDFRHKGFRFVVLDGDFCYLNFAPSLPEYQEALDYYNSLSGQPQRQWWNAAISLDQRTWLMDVLDESSVLDEPAVIMCHYPIHNPIGHHSLLNSTEMLDIVNGYSNVVMWLNGHNHSGDYALEGRRHHVNLKGMQNEAENWYEIEFSPDRVLVYQAEETNTPAYDLDISRTALTVDPPSGFDATNTAGVASLSWNAEPAGVTSVVIEARHVPTAGAWQVVANPASPTGGSHGHTPAQPAAEYKYRIRFKAGTALSRYSEALSPGEDPDAPDASPADTASGGLIGWWTFDEGAGNTAADSSTNGNTATQAGTAGSWITGKADNAYELGGSGCRFELLGGSGDLQVTGAVTVSAWVNPTSASSYGLIAGIDQTGGSDNDMYALKTDAGDKPYWAVIGPGTDVGLTASSTLAALAGGGWVHLVAVYDPATGFAGLYTNGVLDVSTTTVPTSIQLKSTPFQIGHNAADSGSYPLNAAVDDIQVYDQALSSAQIAYLYNSPGNTLPAEPSDTPPIGWWKLDDGSGTNAVDSSGNGYHLDQVNGDGSWTSGKRGGAYNQPRFTADAAESDALNLAGNGTVSLSMWVTVHSTASWAGMAGFEGTGADGDIFSLKMQNNDKIAWTMSGASSMDSPDTLANYAAATGDGWVHIVGVYDGGNTNTLYINGSPVATGTAVMPIPDKTTPSLFRLGTYFNSSSYEFNGSIDDVQLYEQALSAEQVAELYSHPGMALPILRGTVMIIR